MPDKIAVFGFTIYDIASDRTVRSLRKGTREAVAIAQGTALEDTAEEVDADQLDGNGFLQDT